MRQIAWLSVFCKCYYHKNNIWFFNPLPVSIYRNVVILKTVLEQLLWVYACAAFIIIICNIHLHIGCRPHSGYSNGKKCMWWKFSSNLQQACILHYLEMCLMQMLMCQCRSVLWVYCSYTGTVAYSLLAMGCWVKCLGWWETENCILIGTVSHKQGML